MAGVMTVNNVIIKDKPFITMQIIGSVVLVLFFRLLTSKMIGSSVNKAFIKAGIKLSNTKYPNVAPTVTLLTALKANLISENKTKTQLQTMPIRRVKFLVFIISSLLFIVD